MELNCLYDIEVPPKEIFNLMKTNIYNNFSTNSFSSISKEYLSIRNDLFYLIKKISSKMGFKSQTYFLSVYYLDILFSQNKKIDCNHNILGLACLLLSAKYCENDPCVPELKYFIKIYNRLVGSKNSISVSDLFYSEVIACKMLNHKLNYYTIYDFNSFFFSHNILKDEQLDDINIEYDNGKNEKHNRFTGKEKKIMERIYRKSRYYLDNLIESPISLKYNSLLLSIYIMKKSIEFTLLNEHNFDKYDYSLKDKFIKKTNDCFNSIINGYYNIDYENIPEYQKLIEEYDFIKIFKIIKKEKNDFNPINLRQSNDASTSFNKTPNKPNNINIKSLNQRISEINFSSSKKNFHKLKSNNSIHNKMNSTTSLICFSGKNMPRVSFHQSQNLNMNHRTLYRNLDIDGCNKSYKQKEEKEKIFSEKKIKNKDGNKLVFLFRLNSQNSFNHHKLKFSDKNIITATSPLKFGNTDKKIQNYNYEIKKDSIIKKTKTKEFDFDKNNCSSNDYNKSVGKDSSQSVNNNFININSNRPYFKKVVQNCGNKLKNFNQIRNKYNNNYNLDNNNNQDTNRNEKNEEKSEEIKPLYNIVNRMPKYKLNNTINKEEINNDTKGKININKKFNLTVNKDKDINISNIKKEHNYKDKKISKLLHINLNPKFSFSNNTPLASLFVNKKNEDFFSTTTYINKTNTKKKKYETKTAKPINNLAKSIDSKISYNIKSNNLNKQYDSLFSKQSVDSTISNRDRGNNYEKRNFNIFNDSNDLGESIFSNTLTTSLQGTRRGLMNLKREKEKDTERDKNNLNNKVILTDYTLSGDENNNNYDGDFNDFIDSSNLGKFNTKTIKNVVSSKTKRIQVKKNKFENDYNNIDKNEEKYKNYKKMKSQNLALYKGSLNHNAEYRNNNEESNDEDSNNINQKHYLLYSLKNRHSEEDHNLTHHFKKNPSTIVINNNININFGNKSNLGMKDKKRYKNLIKNTQIQINKNNGPNSISSLLHKIPLCYNNPESSINVRKTNIINISNK